MDTLKKVYTKDKNPTHAGRIFCYAFLRTIANAIIVTSISPNAARMITKSTVETSGESDETVSLEVISEDVISLEVTSLEIISELCGSEEETNDDVSLDEVGFEDVTFEDVSSLEVSL